MSTRVAGVYGGLYTAAALVLPTLVLPVALPRGGPSGGMILSLAAIALAGIPLTLRARGSPWRGAVLGGLFWAVSFGAGALIGGLALSGLGGSPLSMVGNALWLGLRSLVGAIAGLTVARRVRGLAGIVIGGLVYWASQLNIAALAFSGGLGLLSWKAPELLLGLAGAGAAMEEERGFWYGAGLLVAGEVLLGSSPIVGGVLPLERVAGGLVGLSVVLMYLQSSEAPPGGAPGGFGGWRLLGYLLAVLVPLVAAASGVRIVVVTSGSMVPTLGVGDLAVVVPGSPRVGDVALYRHGNGLVIHRVVAQSGGVLVTKGDANPAPDPWRVGNDSVVGVMRLRIPLAGKPLLWLRALAGGAA